MICQRIHYTRPCGSARAGQQKSARSIACALKGMRHWARSVSLYPAPRAVWHGGAGNASGLAGGLHPYRERHDRVPCPRASTAFGDFAPDAARLRQFGGRAQHPCRPSKPKCARKTIVTETLAAAARQQIAKALRVSHLVAVDCHTVSSTAFASGTEVGPGARGDDAAAGTIVAEVAFASCCSLTALSWPSPTRFTRYCQTLAIAGSVRETVYISRIVIRVAVQTQENLVANSKFTRFHHMSPNKSALETIPLNTVRHRSCVPSIYKRCQFSTRLATAAQCRPAPSRTSPCHPTLWNRRRPRDCTYAPHE